MERAPKEVFELRDPERGATGWLVVDTEVDGLAFGGFRLAPAVTREEVEHLARCMTWKLAGHGAPVGGAKAGLRCDPRDPDTPALLRRFAEACRAPLSRSVMLGKDMGATDDLIDGMYASLGRPQLAIVQARWGRGVPDRLRDLTGYRRHMTGLGVAWAALEAAGGSLEGARVAIQGFGLVGAGAALRMEALGARIVAVSDAAGMVRRAGGLPVDALLARRRPDRTLDRAALPEGVEPGRREDLFGVDADVLVLAGASHSLDEQDAERVGAPLVIEGANFGLTDGARRVLHRRGAVVVPDLVASSSSAAMVARQMAAGNGLPSPVLWAGIQEAIRARTGAALAEARRRGVDCRTAFLAQVTDVGSSPPGAGESADVR